MKSKKISADTKKNNFSTFEAPKPQFFWHSYLVFFVGIVVYANTLFHQFTQDDAIVIYDNMFTTQGIKGIPGLFKYDTFYGFFKEEGKAKLVSGGRYRPFTPAMFAVEYELAGQKPFLGHLLNILYYGLLCFLIYKTMLLLLGHKGLTERDYYLALMTALLYAVHPLHTEVVANIKGRDEIISMMASMAALYLTIKSFDTQKSKYLIWASLALFVGLLSKENTITFLGIIPLALYFFRECNLGKAIIFPAMLFVPTILFILIRTSILGFDMGGAPMELMNNPFIKLVGNQYVEFSSGEKLGTILFTLGKYLALLVFPHPLTHDYYPRHIDIMTMGNIYVLLSLLVYAILGFLAFKGWKDRKLYSFAILYFLITTSIISNIVFPIGTNMSERFMFMPSLGFSILISWLIVTYLLPRGKTVMLAALVTICVLFSIKTIMRNQVWKNDFTLFTTDVHTSTNSAKVLNAAGGSLTDASVKETNPEKKQKMLTDAIAYLERAIEVHPNYKNAYLIKGNAHYYLQQYDEAIKTYEICLRIDPNFKDAMTNLAVNYRDAGRQAGEKENNIAKAEGYLQKAYELKPNDAETVRLLGIVFGIQGKHAEAITFFTKASEMMPDNASVYYNLGNAYKSIGDETNAKINLQKALSIDPEVFKNMQK